MSGNYADLPGLLAAIARRRILVIGDVMLDHYIVGDATRISPEAPVPVVHVSRENDTVGGAANVAHNISALGASVEVVGAIGDDANGAKLRAHLRDKQIEFDSAFVLPGVPTITKTRVIVRNQQLCRLDHEEPPGAYGRVLASPANLRALEDKIAASDGVILSDYAKGVLTTVSIEHIVRLARRHKKFIALDPKPASGNRYHDFDHVTPNLKEAIELSGLPAPAEGAVDLENICAAIWTRLRPAELVVTLGSEGMLISSRGKVVRQIATAALQVYDVSGAGDTVIAALTLARTSGADLEAAANFANGAAGIVVGKLGTATVTPGELLERARVFRSADRPAARRGPKRRVR